MFWRADLALVCSGLAGSLLPSAPPNPPPPPPPPTVDELMPGAIARVRRELPAPVLAMNPPADVGGIVNIGLWLAVAPAAPVVARAEVRGVWAQAAATPVATTWNMGNGTIIECAGFGDPIPPELLASVEQSPECGYTYRWPSLPEFTGTGELAYPVSVTMHWSVRLMGSDGRDDAGTPIDFPLEFTYPVREIQTVGVPAH